MLGLVPFVMLCVVLAVAAIVWFARWQRRDRRAGNPWQAETAAKIYIGTIAIFLVAALGLASTPLVALGTEEVLAGSFDLASGPSHPFDTK